MKVLHRVVWQTLRKNRARTWVTIIGILLSAAMFTAVATCVSSLQGYLIDVNRASVGSWHGALYDASDSAYQALCARSDVRTVTALSHMGYAAVDSKNTYKPYLYLMGIDEQADTLLPIHLTDGRLPENEQEILLPQHLETNGGVIHTLGDTLALTPGVRQYEGEVLNQFNPFLPEETFLPGSETKTYTVVGFYERPGFEEYSAPGYTALTFAAGETRDIYIEMKKPAEITGLLEEYQTYSFDHNSKLLEAYGYSLNAAYNRIVYNVALILIAIIVLGSIALIYNAFSISLSERMHLFGILKSVGATRRQLRGAVLFEALLLSLAGVPAGVLAGVGGIGVTLHFTGGLFAVLDLDDYNLPMRLHLRPPLLIAAALLAVITVLISAWLPARKACRRTPLEAIRQTGTYCFKPRALRVGRWVRKVFGFEGTLAAKNFKRSRRRYRVTVFSLFVSIVLFISTSSFCAYLNRAAGELVDYTDYDLTFQLDAENGDPDSLLSALRDCSAIDGVSYAVDDYSMRTTFPEGALSDSYAAEEQNAVWASTFYLSDDRFFAWVKEQGLTPADYMDPENPVAVVCDLIRYYGNEESQYISYHLLTASAGTFTYFPEPPQTLNDYSLVDSEYNDNTLYYIYENKLGERVQYAEHDPIFTRSGAYRGKTDRAPLGASERSMLVLVYPASAYTAVTGQQPYSYSFYIEATAAAKAEEQVAALLCTLGLPSKSLYSSAADQAANRALVTIINVFSYGFIILISLIALANVFNTISTNIALRRREFAMLRSVGLTERGFQRMMRYECLLYGAKGLLWGLPVAVLVTYRIWRSFSSGWTTSFYLPWHSVYIAVASVFIVVFATMLYATGRLRKENPIDALKNENL